MKVIDLFSGIGGFSLGLESTGGFETVQFVENNEWCQKVLAKNFPNVPITGDIKNYEPKRSNGIGLVCGGFPCQPFSVAGKRKGTEDDRHLWSEMLRVIKASKPRWVIGENVRNLTSIQDGMVFEQVCTDLENEGYEVQSFIIPASAVNAPHQRYRVWIVAYSKLNGFSATKKRKSIKETIRQESQGQNRTLDSQRASGLSETTRNVGNRSGIHRQTSWWSSEPNVGRVAHGVSDRVDRLKGLGNAIVPQIAYQIGLAILEAEDEHTKVD